MSEHVLSTGSAPSVPEPDLTRDRQFMTLLFSHGVSAIGDATSAAALPLLVLALTHSGKAMGLVGMLQALPPLLIDLPAGALADRWDRRRLMIACDIARGLLVALIALSLPMGLPTLAVILAVVTPIGVFSSLFEAAFFGAVPALAGRARLGTANGYLHATYGVGVVIGPALAGVLSSTIGPGPTQLVDSVSFFISALCLLFIRRPLREPSSGGEVRASVLQSVRESLGFILQQRSLRAVLLFWSVINFVFSPLVPVVSFFVTVDRGMSAAAFGFIVSAYAMGSVLGSILATRSHHFQGGRALILGCALNGLGMGVLTVVRGLPWLITVALLTGVVSAMPNVAFLTLRSGLTPDAMQSRVGSTARSMLMGFTPLGILAAGLLLDAIGGGRTLALMGGLILGLSLLGTLSGDLRLATVNRTESLPPEQ